MCLPHLSLTFQATVSYLIKHYSCPWQSMCKWEMFCLLVICTKFRHVRVRLLHFSTGNVLPISTYFDPISELKALQYRICLVQNISFCGGGGKKRFQNGHIEEVMWNSPLLCMKKFELRGS